MTLFLLHVKQTKQISSHQSTIFFISVMEYARQHFVHMGPRIWWVIFSLQISPWSLYKQLTDILLDTIYVSLCALVTLAFLKSYFYTLKQCIYILNTKTVLRSLRLYEYVSNLHINKLYRYRTLLNI
jgi:hypothetical protein